MTAEIEAIATEFEQVPALLARAGQTVTAVGEKSGQVAAQAAATGMTGVGQRMLAIREQVRAMYRALSAAAGTGDQVLTALRAAVDPSSSGEVVEHLRVAGERLDALREQMVAVAGQLASIKAQVEVALRGAQPGPLLNRLDTVYQYLVAVVQRGDAVRQRITAAITAAAALGAKTPGIGDRPADAGPHGAASGGQHPEKDELADPEPAKGFVRHRDHIVPAFAVEIAAELTVPPGAKTAGVLTDDHGQRLHPDVLLNGSQRAVVDNLATVKSPWHRLDATIAHVEGHASGILRERPVSHAVLVVTRRPCRGRAGCHAVLAELLDRGDVVDVYVARGRQAVYWGTYTGTGEGVARS